MQRGCELCCELELIPHRTLASLALLQRASKRKILALVHAQVYADDILLVWADPNAQVTTAPLIAFTQQDRIQGG